jgi:CCR4-NOT transcriptional complex subunit CAF120
MSSSPSLNGTNFNNEAVSPELAPIVTLLSAQAHRRYNEGVFMLLQSINVDGEPVPNRQWREVYGVLLGTQLAIWNVEELEKYQNDTEALLNASSKPDYINFTDSSFRAVESLENSNGLKNVIIVSTTLKNQYLLQYSELEDFHKWGAAFRLATFEYTSLQEAYTGALLSARGSKLSDIRTILAETKFAHEDWVSVRFGSGMPWKRCYAVIEQPSKKSRNGKVYKGTVSFYKDEKKQKKGAMAVIRDANAAYALYPNSVKMIDHSTMIKLEGTVYFDTSKKALPKEASVYFMPEQHSAVPGYDTLIRFLVPLLNAFALYGRPKRLNADKNEMNSLLFGLPVLPHVHYLEVDDLILLSSNSSASNWLVTEWRTKIKEVLARKLASGYTGCGSSHGVIGAMSSPAITSTEFLGIPRSGSSGNLSRPMSPLSPSFLPAPKFRRDSTISKTSSKSTLNVGSPDNDDFDSPPNPEKDSDISQIYEGYATVTKMGERLHDEQQKDRSNESLSTNGRAPGTGLGFSSGTSGLADPYVPHQNDKAVPILFQNPPEKSLGNPYAQAKQKQSLLDEEFDDDEIFQKGVSALSIHDQQKSNGDADIFMPDYANAPRLDLQSSSKSLLKPLAFKTDVAIEKSLPSPSDTFSEARPQVQNRKSYDSYHGRLAMPQIKPSSSQQVPQVVVQSPQKTPLKPESIRSGYAKVTPPSSQEHLPRNSPQGPRQLPNQSQAPYPTQQSRNTDPYQQHTRAPQPQLSFEPHPTQKLPQRSQQIPLQQGRPQNYAPQQFQQRPHPQQQYPPLQRPQQPQPPMHEQRSYQGQPVQRPPQGYQGQPPQLAPQAPHVYHQRPRPPQSMSQGPDGQQPPQRRAAPSQGYDQGYPLHQTYPNQRQQQGYQQPQVYQQQPFQGQQYGSGAPPRRPVDQMSSSGSFGQIQNPYSQGNPYAR